MATTVQGTKLTKLNRSTQYSENLLPYTLSFNDNSAVPSVTSGTGTATLSTIQPFDGRNCLRLINGAPGTALVAAVTGTLQLFNATADGSYPFQFSVRNLASNLEPATGRIIVFINTIAQYYIEFDTEDVYDQWVTFFYSLPLFNGDEVSFRYELYASSTAASFTTTYIDGLKIEIANRLGASATTYSQPNNIIRLVTSLNFGSTPAGDTTVLDVTFDQSIPGEAVMLGVPYANITAGGIYLPPYVDVAGNIKVPFWNNTGSTIDPPLGNFTLTIVK